VFEIKAIVIVTFLGIGHLEFYAPRIVFDDLVECRDTIALYQSSVLMHAARAARKRAPDVYVEIKGGCTEFMMNL